MWLNSIEVVLVCVQVKLFNMFFFLVIKDILTQTIQMEDILDVIMLLAHGCLSMSTQC